MSILLYVYVVCISRIWLVALHKMNILMTNSNAVYEVCYSLVERGVLLDLLLTSSSLSSVLSVGIFHVVLWWKVPQCYDSIFKVPMSNILWLNFVPYSLPVVSFVYLYKVCYIIILGPVWCSGKLSGECSEEADYSLPIFHFTVLTYL